MGRLIGHAVLETEQAVGKSVLISLPTYAVVGAAAVLGGMSRMTLSITVLVTETTGAYMLIVPIMVAVFFSKARDTRP